MNALKNLSTYERLVANYLKGIQKKMTFTFKTHMDGFLYNRDHIIQRMEERDLILNNIASTFNTFYKKEHITTFNDMLNEDESTRPFVVSITGAESIIVFNRRDNYWSFTSVLNPVMHNRFKSTKDVDFNRKIIV